ncbi:hypothetical protein MP228_004519 [Amoeboaphelidium protococcarum]|nr:hypothetical protein MP228_004519 [Amoeboaphelidium protococcarum]
MEMQTDLQEKILHTRRVVAKWFDQCEDQQQQQQAYNKNNDSAGRQISAQSQSIKMSPSERCGLGYQQSPLQKGAMRFGDASKSQQSHNFSKEDKAALRLEKRLKYQQNSTQSAGLQIEYSGSEQQKSADQDKISEKSNNVNPNKKRRPLDVLSTYLKKRKL